MKEATHKTFTLIELILVVAIIAIFAAAMIAMVTSARQEALASRILQDIEALKVSCSMYNHDTGAHVQQMFPCYVPAFCAPGNNTFRGLIADNGVPGWDGPYLSGSLEDYSSFSGDMLIMGNIGTDFDLDGDGTNDVLTGNPGNMLIVDTKVGESVAKIINDHLDNGVLGDWKTTGRVKVWTGMLPSGDSVVTTAVYLLGGR